MTISMLGTPIKLDSLCDYPVFSRDNIYLLQYNKYNKWWWLRGSEASQREWEEEREKTKIRVIH